MIFYFTFLYLYLAVRVHQHVLPTSIWCGPLVALIAMRLQAEHCPRSVPWQDKNTHNKSSISTVCPRFFIQIHFSGKSLGQQNNTAVISAQIPSNTAFMGSVMVQRCNRSWWIWIKFPVNIHFNIYCDAKRFMRANMCLLINDWTERQGSG